MRLRRWARRVAIVVVSLVTCAVLLLGLAWMALWAEYSDTPSAAARGVGHDAIWLGHAWLDGRKGQSDLDGLAKRLRAGGIRDLFVHTGPFENDGSLNAARRPQARWFIDSVHAALPGVRVQAWLGAHPVPGELDLASEDTHARLLASVEQVLADGFDGVHYDFEPIVDGDSDLLTVLRKTRVLTRARRGVLSVSTIHHEPWSGMASCVKALPTYLALWSVDYLRRVALEVDQVAVMAYDTSLPTQGTFGGYVRRATQSALEAVPAEVGLLIGVPAYHDENFYHHARAETMTAALRGVRLALGQQSPQREFGVALYVDFAATEADWAAYHEVWAVHLQN